MKIRIRNILFLAALQDLLVLIACVASAASFNAWLIVAGQSHHFVPEASRRALNQSQHTLGLEFTRGPWIVQASHMEDSFGCSSNEIALARRWPLMHADEIKGGLMLGIVAAHRCTSRGTFRYVTSRRTELVSISTLPGGHYTNCVFDPFPFELGWYCYVPVSVTSPVFSPAVPHWVYGILPGAYLDVGRRVRLEATLVQSPFTGHHLVFYAQLLFRLASWK